MDSSEKEDAELVNASASILFDALLNQTQDQVYFKDRQSRFVRASDVVSLKFGLKSTAELIGKSDFDFFSKEHAQESFEDEQRLMRENEKLINITEKETWPDGSITWATSTKIPLYLESGNVVGIMGITRDITDQTNSQRELEENRELLERKNQIMETDFDNARRIQRRLIPGPIPQPPFAEIAILNLSMTEVNGDVIAFPTVDENHLSFLLGDVSGHGVSAGLFTILIKHLADFYMPGDFDRLDRALVTLDEHLQGLIPAGFVATLLGSIVLLPNNQAKLTLANAGQPSALWFNQATSTVELVELPSENVIGLGICDQVECRSFELSPGDCFLFVSDGAVECRNGDDVELGLEGLIAPFQKCAQLPIDDIIEVMHSFLSGYSNSDFPQDDTSMIALRIKKVE
ncbi:MAG: SpoIIE family protein phosphatase [Opitutales bacterium]|nr:SpoIIE family protein phosphatase [Opitutales bacterium]MBT5813719.1 SpoIIE family protein phosphatase [Opitutales bacterium]MBT6378903.1 SpoIIE family protein phosphatase [Opitutales bacterium]MBT6768711.1 SpoIIE family protein phosphatase [Opitutales bacterium]MBT7865818.1 SpoIIE family protein phosphatase [Opitutales bacterium]